LIQHALRLTPLQHCLERIVLDRLLGHGNLSLVVPTDQWRKADDERQDPSSENQQLCPLRRHDVRVRDGVRHGDVAVEADNHQVQNGGRAHPDVDRQPDGTPDGAEEPEAEDFVHGREGKHHQPQHQVRAGERHDEEVGGASQLVSVEDRDDDHHVAEDDDQTNQAERNERADDDRVLEVNVIQRTRTVLAFEQLEAAIVADVFVAVVVDAMT